MMEKMTDRQTDRQTDKSYTIQANVNDEKMLCVTKKSTHFQAGVTFEESKPVRRYPLVWREVSFMRNVIISGKLQFQKSKRRFSS